VRDFTAHSEGRGAQKQFGAAGLRVAGRPFGAWGEFRRDADRSRLLERIGPLKVELRALLEEAARKAAHTRELLDTGRDLPVFFKHEEDPAGALEAEKLLKASAGASAQAAADVSETRTTLAYRAS
jgi:hypothetical protein